MKKQLKTMEISKFPELVKIAERVHRTGQPMILRRNGTTLAVVRPIRSSKRKSSRRAASRKSLRGKPFTRDDALWNLVGIGRSGIPGGVSEKKHEYFLEAYRSKHQ